MTNEPEKNKLTDGETGERKWSDFKKWTFDVLKNLITFAVVSVMTVVIINPSKLSRNFEQFIKQNKWKSIFEARMNAVENFNIQGRRYRTATLKAFLVAFNGNAYLSTHEKYEKLSKTHGAGNSLTDYGKQAIKNFHDEAWPKFDAAIATLDAWYAEDGDIKEKLKKLRTNLFNLKKLFDKLRSANSSANLDKDEANEIKESRKWRDYKSSNGELGKILNEFEKLHRQIFELCFKAASKS